MSDPVQPWHDSSKCPECSAPCATPRCRMDTPTARTFSNPSLLWCPACGAKWAASNAEAVAQAWWSLGAHEGKEAS